MSDYSSEGKPLDTRFRTFQEQVQANLWQKYSQNGEDAILDAVFARIGTKYKIAVECGAADGLWFSNTRNLIEQGWKALLIESDEEAFEKLFNRYKANENIALECRTIQAAGKDSFDNVFREHGLPQDFDLLVIDVDGMDCYLFNSLLHYKPIVIVCEYDPAVDRMFQPEYGGEGQAGQDIIRYIAQAKGYQCIGRTLTNLIFVRDDAAMLIADGDEPFAEGQEAANLNKPEQPSIKVAAAMSTPRVGFLGNMDCIVQSLIPFGIQLARGEGAFWSQTLTRAIERSLEVCQPDYILTIDYDSMFSQQDVAKLVMLMHDNPDVDVIVPMQQKREGGELLASTTGDVSLADALLPLKYGHFGLTLFRADVFDKLPKPWFYEKPGADGRWEEGRIDADIGFWKNCEESGLRVMLATDVIIGHLELVVTVPDIGLQPLYISMNNYRQGKRPENMFSRERVVEHLQTLDMG